MQNPEHTHGHQRLWLRLYKINSDKAMSIFIFSDWLQIYCKDLVATERTNVRTFTSDLRSDFLFLKSCETHKCILQLKRDVRFPMAVGHAQQSLRFSCEIWKRTVQLRFDKKSRKKTVRLDFHGCCEEISFVPRITRTLT